MQTTTYLRNVALLEHGDLSFGHPVEREVLDRIGRNADIESFAMHSKNLVFFLYGKKPTSNDVVAAFYFDRASDWASVRPDRPKSLALVNQRVRSKSLT